MDKLNQKGLGNLAVLVILAVSAFLVGAAGYFTWSNANRPAQPVSQTAPQQTTKKYTDASKLFTVSHPQNWTITAHKDCCEGTPPDYSKIPRPFTLLPPGVKETLQGVSVQADKTAVLATTIRNGWKDNNHTPQAIKTNGYPAEYVRIDYKSDAERYIDHQVLISHKGASVYVTFRVMHKHPMSNTDFDHSKYTDEFTDILNSVTFLN